MTSVEERLRELRAATHSGVKASPDLLLRIRQATEPPDRREARVGRRGRARPSKLLVLALAAAAGVVLVLVTRPPSLPKSASHAPVPAAAVPEVIPSSFVYEYAASDPGALQVTLVSPDGRTTVPVIVVPDGVSVLGRGNLALLPKAQTYELWGVVADQPVSLGVVGPNPDYVSFTAPAGVTMLFLTAEGLGGVTTSGKVPVVTGVVNSPGFDGGGDWIRNGAQRSRVV